MSKKSQLIEQPETDKELLWYNKGKEVGKEEERGKNPLPDNLFSYLKHISNKKGGMLWTHTIFCISCFGMAFGLFLFFKLWKLIAKWIEQ